MIMFRLGTALRTVFSSAFSAAPDHKLRASIDKLETVMAEQRARSHPLETIVDEMARR